MIAHITLTLVAVTVVLPLSILPVPNVPYRVHRAWYHVLLQIVFIGLLIAAVILAPSSLSTSIHKNLGYVLLAAGLPLATFSRFFSPIWHALLGHGVALFAYGVSFGGTALAYPGPTPDGVVIYVILSLSLTLYVVRLIIRYLRPMGIRRMGRTGQYGPLNCDCPVEGSGWSFILRHHWPSGGTLSTRPLAGRTPASVVTMIPESSEGEWWGAGTTIAALQRDLRKRGLTLAGHPTLKGGTLGAWIASGAHGSGGTLWTPAFSEAIVVDRRERTVSRIRNPKAFSFSSDGRHVVVEVCVTPVPDVECVREAYDVCTMEDATKFLTIPTHLRLIFVDACAPLAFVWRRLEEQEEQEEERKERRYFIVSPWLATLLPSSWSARLPRETWKKRMRLSTANNFAPDPPMWATWAMLAYTNFEIFASVAPTPNLLLGCCDTLQQLFAHHPDLNGRCEIRCGSSKMFFDFAMRSRDHRPLLAALRSVLGPRVPFSLHRGKAQIELNIENGKG